MELETVLVIPTEHFEEIGYFEGFTTYKKRLVSQLLYESRWRLRNFAEHSDEYKQIIPYGIIRYTTETINHATSDGPTFFSYTRGKSLGENRLELKSSLGVGGHVNNCDSDKMMSIEDIVKHCLYRELDEELDLSNSSIYQIEELGLIYDPSNDVGKKHIGIAYLIDVTRKNIKPKEEGIIETGFIGRDKILKDIDKYESWSQIIAKII